MAIVLGSTQALAYDSVEFTVTRTDEALNTSTTSLTIAQGKATLSKGGSAFRSQDLTPEVAAQIDDAAQRLADRAKPYTLATTHALYQVEQPVEHFRMTVRDGGEAHVVEGYLGQLDTTLSGDARTLISQANRLRFVVAAPPLGERERVVTIKIQKPGYGDPQGHVTLFEGKTRIDGQLRLPVSLESLRTHGDGATLTLVGTPQLTPENGAPFVVREVRVGGSQGMTTPLGALGN